VGPSKTKPQAAKGGQKQGRAASGLSNGHSQLSLSSQDGEQQQGEEESAEQQAALQPFSLMMQVLVCLGVGVGACVLVLICVGVDVNLWVCFVCVL